MTPRTQFPRSFVLAGILALGCVTGASATSSPLEDDSFRDDGYRSGDVARVLHVENGISIVRAEAAPVDEGDAAGANTPLYSGDSAITGIDQRAEIQLADGTLIRLDRATELRLQSLPAPYREIADNTILGLIDGTIMVQVPDGMDVELRIDAEGGTTYLIGAGEFRIESGRNGRLRAWSYRGVAEVSGDGGSVLVRAGTRTEAWSGAYPTEPVPFNTVTLDRFERWSADRDRYWARIDVEVDGGDPSDAYDALPYEVRPHYAELSRHGSWVWDATFGWCWVPVGVSIDWRPYYDGHWASGPGGWFWVSNEPWGWAPYRYGRWERLSGYGWCWIPGRVFGGAWVSWSWGTVHVGWAPLGYWNRPVVYGNLHLGYYGHRSWTFVRYEHLHRHSYRRHAVPVRTIGRDHDGRARASRPSGRSPGAIARDPEVRRRAIADVRERERADRSRPEDGRARASRRAFREREDDLIRTGARRADARNPERIDRTSRAERSERGPGGTPRPTARGRAGASRDPGRPTLSTPPRPPRTERPSRPPRAETPDRGGREARDAAGRRPPVRDRRTPLRDERIGRGDARGPGASRGGPVVRPRSPASGGRDAEERVRELYRTIAPRRPSDRSRESEARDDRRRTPSAQERSPARDRRERTVRTPTRSPRADDRRPRRESAAPTDRGRSRRVEPRERRAPQASTPRRSGTPRMTPKPPPRQVEPKRPTPRRVEPRRAAPKRAEPKRSTPRRDEPRRASPRNKDDRGSASRSRGSRDRPRKRD